MLRKPFLITVTSICILLSLPISTSNALIPVECPKCATVVTQLKDSIVMAKQLATEISSYVQLANTYATAVQNTVKLPLDALAQVQGVYYRATNIMDSTGRLLSSDAPMMQRLAMAQGLASRTGRLPDGTVRNAEWWGARVEDQWADNQELLGLEQERRQVNADLLELAASNGDLATGQFQQLQVLHQTSMAMANELQALNANQEKAFLYTLEKDSDEYLKDKAYQDFMTQREKITEKAW